LLERLREDRLNVAFVAEFSRGKSELINAIFFADYGNRMLPSSAGRTTMCPTELLFDATSCPASNCCRSRRALPIPASANTSAFRRMDQGGARYRSPDAMQDALRHVSETTRVTPEEAAASGLRSARADRSVRVGDDGLVEVPRWRHAMINFPHPCSSRVWSFSIRRVSTPSVPSRN
jgi:hypothetical protein